MAAPNPAMMLSSEVLVDTEVLTAEGMEDDAARLLLDGAALLSLAASIHVGTDGSDGGGGGGGGAGEGTRGAASCRPPWCGCSGAAPPR